MRKAVRDFWLLLLLAYGMVGFSLFSAEAPGVNRALACVTGGRTDEAIAVLGREIGRHPAAADAHLSRGVACLEKGDYPAAQGALKKAVRQDPSSVAAHSTLAMLYEKRRQFGRASAEWRAVFELAGDPTTKDLANKHILQLEGKQLPSRGA